MIQLSKNGNTVTFTFDENSGYLQNGTIAVPVNSLSLILDESDMATFRKSASNDIFVSALVGDFGMSKSELEAWYKANMVGATGGGGGDITSGEVQTMIDESISGKADSVSAVSSAEYVSSSTTINFKNADGTVISSIDASDFVIDGMIDDVRIETISGVSYLVIDFNTASGKEDIKIPLTDIFNPDNYYDKTSVDGIVSGLNASINTKLDASAYTPTDLSEYWTSAQTTSAIDAATSGKADTSAVTQSINAAVSGKQDTLIEGRAIDITNNSVSLDLPISAGTGSNAIVSNDINNIASGECSYAGGWGNEYYINKATNRSSWAFGVSTQATNQSAHAEGERTIASGYSSHAEGYQTIAGDQSSHSEGAYTNAKGFATHAEGYQTIANNWAEHASGQYNVSSSGSSTFGDSGNTLFSVGNGTTDNARHNAFEIRQNGDIYLTSGGTDILLQDHLGGGGGGESCTVDATTIYDVYSGMYSNDTLDMRVNYVVLDYTGDKTQGNANVDVYFRDENYNTYVNQYIYFDYPTSSYTLGDQSQAEYIDITYDSTIEDFKIAVASAYTSTVFVGRISNFWDNYIKVPFYTISSGSPCTVIENDVTSAITETREAAFKGLKLVSITTDKSIMQIYTEPLLGFGNINTIKFDEIDGSGNRLKPDIYVGLGTSGWTEIDITQNQCSAENLKGTKFRVTYDYSEFNAYNMNLALSVSWAGNTEPNYLNFDDQTQQPSLQSSTFTAATVDWNASTKELVITYPTTIDWYGDQVSVNIERFENYACQFGQAITKLESYGENKQALKPYVQQNRAALGGLKLQQVTQAQYDALVSGGTVDNSTIYYIVN